MAIRALTLLALATVLTACASTTEDDQIRAQVTVLSTQEGLAAQHAADSLARHGRRALVTIEAAMHTASPSGRKNLILAARRIGDGEAIPLLRHIALYDRSPEVRREAEWTLKQWAAAPTDDPRGARARAALRALDERRGREEPG